MIIEPVRRLARPHHRGGRGPDVMSQPSRSRGRISDGGTVTAETAVAIPSLLVLLMIFVWVILVVTAQLRVVDAARAGARAAARGESFARSLEIAEEAAPNGADAFVSRAGDDIGVTVRVAVRPPGGIPVLPVINVDAVAYAAVEDTLTSGDDP